jgi:hypothetical protein
VPQFDRSSEAAQRCSCVLRPAATRPGGGWMTPARAAAGRFWCAGLVCRENFPYEFKRRLRAAASRPSSPPSTGAHGSPQPTARRSTAPPCPPRACFQRCGGEEEGWKRRPLRGRLLTALPSPLRGSITPALSVQVVHPAIGLPASCSCVEGAAIAGCSTCILPTSTERRLNRQLPRPNRAAVW